MDVTPNPLEKPGWVLTTHDEFDGPELNTDIWISDYLGSITDQERSRPRYELRDGCLVLKIERDQLPYWTHKSMKASGIQTAQRPALRSHFKDVRDIPTEMKFTQKYGYFEVRAKTYVAEGYHCAFWTVGVNDEEGQEGEIDIFEQYRSPGLDMFNLHRWTDHSLEGKSIKHTLNFDPTEGFNIYALEWDEKSIRKYVNNQLVATIDQSPQYPAVFILSIYENAGWNGKADTSADSGYPKEFVIDYFRAYERADKSEGKEP